MKVVWCSAENVAEMLTGDREIQNPSPFMTGSGFNLNWAMNRESESILRSHQETFGV